jgi:hypothetical protein
MDLVQKAYSELWSDKDFNYVWTIKYSKAFSGYNANIKYTRTAFHFRFSHEWKDVSDDIKIGLIQSLLVKVFKDKKKTTNMDLYNLFLKNVHIGVEKNRIDPILSLSFERVNDKYFAGMIEKPNLVWGNLNFSKLGTYEYGSDTITISKVLASEQSLLDYVMYHEMLHKKLKFSHNKSRNLHHSREFRDKEKEWGDKDVEEKLKVFLRQKKRRNYFKFW